MRSGWFWGTPMWAEYQKFYRETRPEAETWKSSPLKSDHEFYDVPEGYELVVRHAQVIDLRLPLSQLWSGVRKSYRPLINRGLTRYVFHPCPSLADYHCLHTRANGCEVRHQGTWDCMDRWMAKGRGGLILSEREGFVVAGAYFILYERGAYYASGASVEPNAQHAIIWTAIKKLRNAGFLLLEMGQIDGETEKERNIGKFKTGFGGTAVPFTIARRKV